MSKLFGDPAQLVQLQFRNLPDSINTVHNLGHSLEDGPIHGLTTPLAVLENMISLCSYVQASCSNSYSKMLWECNILALLFAIEWIFGLEDTYELPHNWHEQFEKERQREKVYKYANRYAGRSAYLAGEEL